jgi:hypothetical protein
MTPESRKVDPLKPLLDNGFPEASKIVTVRESAIVKLALGGKEKIWKSSFMTPRRVIPASLSGNPELTA